MFLNTFRYDKKIQNYTGVIQYATCVLHFMRFPAELQKDSRQ